MRFVMFCHSALSDWNHGNAHFLRGVATELITRGHTVMLYEPRDAWSVRHLLQERGDAAFAGFRAAYPMLAPVRYDAATLDLDAALDGADVVIVHEWNEPEMVARIGRIRDGGAPFSLFFHDTHHRTVTAPAEMARYDLTGYDGVLAFGDALRSVYLDRGWAAAAWTWHEAADVRVFRPPPGERPAPDADVVWIGNWGDDERTAELHEFIIAPVRDLGISGTAFGVRYPEAARQQFATAGIAYRGWLPNFEAPHAFALHRVTVHVPRRPYARALPGIPTIRMFEALACGVPLVSAPWDDVEGLFRAGTDHFVAADGAAMRRCLRDILHDDALARALADAGRDTILRRHTCAHRVDELLAIRAGIAPRLTTPIPT
jgi:spore maturation protein CgeB